MTTCINNLIGNNNHNNKINVLKIMDANYRDLFNTKIIIREISILKTNNL